ncbi:DHH family phosphoesterase [Lacticaseibacillus pantheris]|jgi:phosphoesterase RecJ-like protein|uniref:Phosphoesterase, DHH family protein n=1 Tax=Lacticaseibacillus pantheris DSM 15945 = JCM 12539 = NBRC 106106 TaxID=1423783 RepID=A0A0R1TUT4_9LACO|nr:bifunctional oligoribonuclease/PAP phosphatase NrnA [Lacticaseibacillus pantheris]KRL85041.1 phosphoesterase, DHH family protein [Lacticaseibacillus pantheris DSM 15945 = JCM 12539 = NBRC 106106]WKF85597.1 bifunctional oligoribonuclease/PAP phosphatase NrnA [Lacticaseibacillus pantheris]
MIQEDIVAAIAAADHIIIHRHQRPDPDAFGSQCGLAAIIKASFPDKRVQVTGADSPSLSWLATMDEVTDADYKDALVIVVDTADTPRIDDDRFDQGTQLIKIDHHPNDDPYGDLAWVAPDASSTSELLVDLVTHGDGQLKLDNDAARWLYAGIVGDTGRFMYNNTTAHTLRDVALLYGFDFDPSAVNQKMNEVTLGQARLQGLAIDEHHMRVSPNGAAVVVISQADLQHLGIAADQYQAAVGSAGRLNEIRAWAMCTEQPEGNYRVSLRSKGAVINDIARAHNGGGHPLASGAKAADQAEIDQIFNELDALLAATPQAPSESE